MRLDYAPNAMSGLRFGADFVVLGAGIIVREQLSRFGGNDRDFVVFAGESANGIDGVKPHDGDELHLIGNVAPKQLNSQIAGNPAVPDANENLALEKRLVSISVCRNSPAMPNARDHGWLLVGGEIEPVRCDNFGVQLAH